MSEALIGFQFDWPGQVCSDQALQAWQAWQGVSLKELVLHFFFTPPSLKAGYIGGRL